ncbi:MAG: hypothetical protein QM723_14800 [Myxococcaceae bacterium]
MRFRALASMALVLVWASGCGAKPATGAGGGGVASGGGSAAGGGAATGGGTATGGGASAGGGSATGGGSAAGGGSASGGGSAVGGGSATGGGSASGGGTADAGTTMPAPHGCVTDVSAGHHKFSCNSINFDVEIPASCAAGGCGVVFDVHGLTMNADQEDKSTGLRALGQTMGYVIVQPTAPSSLIGPSWTPGADDTVVWGFMQDAIVALVLDQKKLHFTGFSQGGAMTWRMVCQHSDVLASAAPVAAADAKMQQPAMPPYILDCPFDSTSAPSQPIPVLQMHGSQDALVPIAKGTQQRDTAVTYWALGAATPVSSDSTYTWTRYSGSNGMVYEFIQHDYVVTPPLIPITLGGHCLAGGDDLNTNGTFGQTMYFSCAPPNSFVWGQALMDFFVAHPRP